MCKDMAFCHLQKKLGPKYGKKFVNKGISASKKIKTIANKFNVTNCKLCSCGYFTVRI